MKGQPPHSLPVPDPELFFPSPMTLDEFRMAWFLFVEREPLPPPMPVEDAYDSYLSGVAEKLQQFIRDCLPEQLESLVHKLGMLVILRRETRKSRGLPDQNIEHATTNEGGSSGGNNGNNTNGPYFNGGGGDGDSSISSQLWRLTNGMEN